MAAACREVDGRDEQALKSSVEVVNGTLRQRPRTRVILSGRKFFLGSLKSNVLNGTEGQGPSLG